MTKPSLIIPQPHTEENTHTLSLKLEKISEIRDTIRSMATAYATLVSLFNNLELIQTHPRHSFSFENKQIQSLFQIVCFLIDFMETGDYHGGGKEAAEVLEKQIASAAHSAEDVIESHVVDQIHAGSTLDGKKRSVFLPDVQKVIEDMEFVRRKAIKVQKVQSEFKAEQPTFSAATSSTPPTSDKDKMVGFDDVLVQLLDLLTGYPSSLQVIPIVGTGGIGKTTLAKNAFQHKLIVEHFDVCLWVTISQQYIVSDILSKLLSSHGESDCGTIDELGVKLRKRLYGRRYLIVLDDMWSVEAWDETKFFFPDTSCGSRIIVTSRQSHVANHFGSLSLAMSFLGKDESWDLFCQKAFADQSCPLELEGAGKKIVEKCGGLPLAIVVVGGHLRMSPRRQEYWENVANRMNSILNSEEKDDQLFDILYLSYSHLPVHLKPCFLYMGVFPEDYDISVSFLMRLWIAEGFLKPKEGKTLEEVGEDCLNDLIGRNLILVVDHIRWRYKWKTNQECGIHDVLRELCVRIAEKEKFFCVFHTSRFIHGERRVVIKTEKMQHVLKSPPLVRSQITWGWCRVLFDSKMLRVLIQRTDKLENIFRRVNLRFLDGYFPLEPSISISLLWNLQTLIVDGDGDLTNVAPYEIWEMTQLRHLDIANVILPCDEFDKANDMVLQNLQTLKDVVNLRLSDEVCERIPNIKELEMIYSHKLADCDEPWSYIGSHNLGRLNKLESLDFSIGTRWHEFGKALTFPRSLKKLSLCPVHLDWEEVTMKIGSLPLLESLDLRYIKGGEEWNPVEGGFPHLKSLHIYYCHDLRNWNAERSHFPVLELLHLECVSKLDELPCGIGEIPTLQTIYLSCCSVSLSISAVRIVVEQEENGNDSIQLHVEFWEKERRNLHLHEEFWDNQNPESFNKIVQEEGLITNNLHLSLGRSY